MVQKFVLFEISKQISSEHNNGFGRDSWLKELLSRMILLENISHPKKD